METDFEKLRLKLARTRMKERKAFYIMLAGCFVLMPYLIFINLKTNPEFHWFWFPLVGFGISILGYSIYLFAGKNWEEKKIREIINNQNNLKNQ
jgi:glycopeptide antibiotics resistance protein